MEIQKDYDAAAAQFVACVDLDTTHVPSHCNLGTIYTELTENYHLARQHYDAYFQDPTEAHREAHFEFTKFLFS